MLAFFTETKVQIKSSDTIFLNAKFLKMKQLQVENPKII